MRREDEILLWVSRAKSNAQTAAILEVSPATVSKHLEHIYPKLGVENRTAAASSVPRRVLQRRKTAGAPLLTDV
jgi:DNA-binding CsgD family transcriptional regulator